MLAVRAVVLVAVGDAVAARIAVVLQILTFVLLVQVFFFLPGILPQLLKDLQAGGTTYSRLPPMWFTGLFIWLADGRTVAPGLALWSAAAVATSALAAAALSVLPAALMRRRDLERRADVSTGPVMPFVRAVARRVVRASDTRALYLFAVASLARSRRHAVHLGTFAGLAVAASFDRHCHHQHQRQLDDGQAARGASGSAARRDVLRHPGLALRVRDPG